MSTVFLILKQQKSKCFNRIRIKFWISPLESQLPVTHHWRPYPIVISCRKTYVCRAMSAQCISSKQRFGADERRLNGPACRSHPPIYTHPVAMSIKTSLRRRSAAQRRGQHSEVPSEKLQIEGWAFNFPSHSGCCSVYWDQLSPPHSVQMLSSRCLLPVVAVYMLLQEISAAALQGALRSKRVGLYSN